MAGERWARAEDEILKENSIYPDNWVSVREISEKLLPHRSPNSIQGRRLHLGIVTGLTRGKYRAGSKLNQYKGRCAKCRDEFISFSKVRKYCGLRKCMKDFKDCEICSKKFVPKIAVTTYPSDRFCSQKCHKKSYPKPKEKQCPICGGVIPPRIRRKRKKLPNGQLKEYIYYYITGKYCSNKCSGLHQAKEGRKQGNDFFITRVFVKFILRLREDNREEYLRIRRLCIKMESKNWKKTFDKRLAQWYSKLRNGQSYRRDLEKEKYE